MGVTTSIPSRHDADGVTVFSAGESDDSTLVQGDSNVDPGQF